MISIAFLYKVAELKDILNVSKATIYNHLKKCEDLNLIEPTIQKNSKYIDEDQLKILNKSISGEELEIALDCSKTVQDESKISLSKSKQVLDREYTESLSKFNHQMELLHKDIEYLEKDLTYFKTQYEKSQETIKQKDIEIKEERDRSERMLKDQSLAFSQTINDYNQKLLNASDIIKKNKITIGELESNLNSREIEAQEWKNKYLEQETTIKSLELEISEVRNKQELELNNSKKSFSIFNLFKKKSSK